MTPEQYIDNQYMVFSNAFYECQIEYQVFQYDRMRKKCDAFINEGTEIVIEAKFDFSKVKALIRKFFDSIIAFMQRWIANVLTLSYKMQYKLDEVFESRKFTAPSMSIKDIADKTNEVSTIMTDFVEDFRKYLGLSDSNESWQAQQTVKLKKELNEKLADLATGISSKQPTDFKKELGQLKGYKSSIVSVKNYQKTMEILANPANDLVFGYLIDIAMKYVRKAIKTIQSRATYSAVLILKAAKLIGKDDRQFADKDVEALNKAIDSSSDELNKMINRSMVDGEVI